VRISRLRKDTQTLLEKLMFPIPNRFDHLASLMGATQLRHGVISQNLANVHTPGYHRLDVQFEELLAEHLKGSGSSGERPQPVVYEQQGLNERPDGNNVDVDREITELNRNAMMFQTYSTLLASQFDLLRRATS
jgi:flagellar basal-body rod protein FlgB